MTLYCNRCCKYQSVVKDGNKAVCAVCDKVLGTFGNSNKEQEPCSSSSPSVVVAADRHGHGGHVGVIGDESA